MTAGAADLHVHTRFSDGTDDPEQVVQLARQAGLAGIAITDHDNTEAIALAEPAARQQGIELITGIEMSASLEGIEVHVLGYLFDLRHPAMVQHLQTQQARRVGRVHETVRKLAAVGVHIPAEEILELAGEGTVGRPHVARILLKHGYISNTAEAFDKYIGTSNPGFVQGSIVPPADIIRLIRQAGGVPVLAHPIYLKRDELIGQFAREGLAGLEVYHSSHTPDQVKRYEALADQLGLLKTGGSDYHGAAHKEGVAVGASRVPASCVDALRRWHAAHQG